MTGTTTTKISKLKFNKIKTYVAHLEVEYTETSIKTLRVGVSLKDGLTKPAKVSIDWSAKMALG
jgi:16S rRNA U516 pseudouridylate synthase RsuA-like enzyme